MLFLCALDEIAEERTPARVEETISEPATENNPGIVAGTGFADAVESVCACRGEYRAGR
jgi:hypothetical protein